MARERDEESGVVYFGSSRGGTRSATDFTEETFQTWSRMRHSPGRPQYDGTMLQPHVRHYGLHETLSGPISEDGRYLLGVSSK